MSLRRLLVGLSAASARLRFRSLSTTAASLPPWAMVDRLSLAYKSEPPTFHLAEPPRYSYLQMSGDLINATEEPGPDSDAEQLLVGLVSSSSGADGLLLLMYSDARVGSPIIAQQGGKQVRHRTGKLVDGHKPDFTYLVCNPLSGQVSRLPNIHGTTNVMCDPYMGLLTQADRGYAVARIYPGETMIRFLSHKGRWDLAECPLPQHPLAHGMGISQEALALGGRLWWVDLSCGAVSVGPFSDRTDSRFVEIPNGSVLPKAAGAKEARVLRQYRRMGVSQGRLRYAEVSQREPFLLSSFALDEDGVGDWTLEHRVALSRVWAADGGGHPWPPLQGEKTPEICVLDPSNAAIIHLVVGEHVVAVDMCAGKVIGSSPLRGHGAKHGFMPCVLGSGQIEQCYTYDGICTMVTYDQTHSSIIQYVGLIMGSPLCV
uniref:Uncharacterized protein n=1 Tax=Avena sativa TaxID=4498 RepID=A0ACD5WW02_AVESA